MKERLKWLTKPKLKLKSFGSVENLRLMKEGLQRSRECLSVALSPASRGRYQCSVQLSQNRDQHRISIIDNEGDLEAATMDENMGRIINEDEKQENKTQPNMTDTVKYVEEKVRISVKNETVSGQDVNGNIEADNKEKCITQIGIQCQNTTEKTGNNSLDQFKVTV